MTDKKKSAPKSSKIESVSEKDTEGTKPAEVEEVVRPIHPGVDRAMHPDGEGADEPTWPLSDWYGFVLKKIGQPSYVLAGAMLGQDTDAEYNETQIRRLVQKFLNAPTR